MREANRLHHALLLKGPIGIGKATLAFHLSWNMLMKNTEFLIPDVSSSMWTFIAKGLHPDFLYISRAYDMKNRNFSDFILVEDIRRISKFLHHTSSNDYGWRIVIIDSADDMNRHAAHALLKILEEPPPRTLFLLISHIPGRLFPTLVSRCQSIVFKSLKPTEIDQGLASLSERFRFDYSQISFDDLIKFSEGSLARAIFLISAGFEIIECVNAIFASPVFAIDLIHRLIGMLNFHDVVIRFDFFLDYLIDFFAKSAFDAVFSGSLNQARKLSSFWIEVEKDISNCRIYNLDKNQFVIILMEKLYVFLRKLR
ncbi:MAG: DNA polymerase III subunit delta' [Candidatus Tokpelaia sp. JSC161]|jgi:DNA polymerase-3 subunit delta'|nr:MAG: DNA polymerase III subunit delta' [Candidatus Tokpelaia sp. JSC161]